jgi:DNA-binding response OmpR family regulator
MDTTSHPGRVLILEDEAIIAMDLEATLTDAGFDIVGNFQTCAAGIEWLGSNHADVAIMDMSLHDGDCDEVARRLVEKGIPFVVFSGSSPESVAVDPVLLTGCWLEKPAPGATIVEAVRAQLPQNA